MRVLTITELRKWTKENGFKDSWWASINGRTLGTAIKLVEVPREGEVLLLNTSLQGAENEEWFVCRYPGYKTQEEIAEKDRVRNLPTIKQVLALEFFGHSQQVTRKEASVLLENHFALPNNYARYQDYLWENFERLYSGRELYEKTVERLQVQMFLIRENAPKGKLKLLIDEATSSGLHYKSFIDLARSKYPEIILSDSTKKRKSGEYESRSRRSEQWKTEERLAGRKGCFGLLVLAMFPGLILIAACAVTR